MNNPRQLIPTDLIAAEVQDNGQSHKAIYNSVINETVLKSQWFYGIEPELITCLHGRYEVLAEATKDRCPLYNGKTISPLLQSNGLYFENPLGKLETCCSGRDCGCMGMPINVSSMKEIDDWAEVESKVIKGKLVILKQV